MAHLSLMGMGGARSAIKSIQQFSITIASGATSNTATINSVNTANSVILFGGCETTATTSCAQGFGRCILTDSTTVTATRDSSGSNTCTVRGAVVEFEDWAVSVAAQTGTITLSASSSSNTATITSVNTSYAFVSKQGHTTSNGGASASVYANAELTNGTTVTVARSGTAGTVTAAYSVIELKPEVIKSIQHRSVSMSTSATSPTDTISSVDFNNTLFVWNGNSSAVSAPDSANHALYIDGTTTVTLIREGVTTSTRVAKYIVVEFQPGVVRRTNFNANIMSGAASSNLDIATTFKSEVDTNKTLAAWLGQSTAVSSTTTMDRWETSARIADASTLTTSKGNSTGSATTYFEALEFL